MPTTRRRAAPVPAAGGAVAAPPTSPAPVDRVTAYALAVVESRIVAGPHVRAACRRHLDDLAEGDDRALRWRVDLADRVIDFFGEMLCLSGDGFEGKPFVLGDWQMFAVGSVFGWQMFDSERGAWVRRFQTAYIETAKGSGKSPLAAGVGMYCLWADGTPRAEVYSAATSRDQAMVLFNDAMVMVRSSPELSAMLATYEGLGKERIVHHASGSFFGPIASDRQGHSGPRPSCSLIDELHEHPNATAMEMLRAGFKSRLQPLMWIITNSGSAPTSVCGIQHAYACKVAAGQIQDDRYFAYVCANDEGDDPFTDEACWPKTNPSLSAGIPGLNYLRGQVREARGMPSKEALVRRLNFCQWTEASNPWLSADVWTKAKRSYTLDDLRGRRAWVGLDLSSTTDLTACVFAVEPAAEGEPWQLWPLCWLPAEGLREREDKDRVPYLAWQAAGYLLTTPGAAINKRHVLTEVAKVAAQFELQLVGYDRWRIADLKAAAEEEGISLPLHDFGQGYKDMGPAVSEFEERLLNGQLVHPGHPVLTWCAANAVVDEDPAGNRKPAKHRATARIDAIVAAVMAVGVSVKVEESEGTSFWESSDEAA